MKSAKFVTTVTNGTIELPEGLFNDFEEGSTVSIEIEIKQGKTGVDFEEWCRRQQAKQEANKRSGEILRAWFEVFNQT